MAALKIFFTLAALLLLIGIEKGNSYVVTLYEISSPPITLPTRLPSLQAFEPLVSESVSVIGTAEDGATRYLVHAFKTAEVVHGVTTTFTQALPTSITATVPLIYTMEQDASHIHQRVSPTIIDSHWSVADSETNCTMDISKNTGECVLQVFNSQNVILLPSIVSWTGVPAPIATADTSEGTSAGYKLYGSSLGGIVAVAFTLLILQI